VDLPFIVDGGPAHQAAAALDEGDANAFRCKGQGDEAALHPAA
jgi:hypothetical protein